MRFRSTTCALMALASVVCASDAVQACGDKFLVVGRSFRFQKAYAAVYPASIVIVHPAKSVKVAAVRDPRLITALQMAGHRVEVVKQPGKLADVLGRSRHDIILAESADVSAIPQAIASGQPIIVGVIEPSAANQSAAARPQLEYVLETPTSLPQILRLLDDVMKARRERSHA